jgi:D-xylose transport system ATP-binding protein
MSGAPLLSARGVTKRFGGVVALKNVTFDLAKGEVHALCGENGAGKSTLIKTLSGIHPFGSYEGELRLDGEVARFESTRDAEEKGIGVIYQELALIDEMTVAENVFLGREPVGRGGFIAWAEMFDRARKVMRRFGLDLDPGARVGDLGVGHKQLVEIAKALSKDSRILVLDEPTAALTDQEAETLLRIIEDLREKGVSCIYISHRLEEVLAISDRITVLRDGETVSTMSRAEATKGEIIRRMVGREITELFTRRPSKTGDTLLSVKHLSVERIEDKKEILHDVSFEVKAGEVFGIGGLMGAGRTELLMHVFGAWGRRKRGDVSLAGEPLDDPPHRAVERGLVLVGEDRKRYGLVLDRDIGFNLSLSSLQAVTGAVLLDAHREHERNEAIFRSLRVKAPGLEAIVGGLSGGNQQKVVLGKALLAEPRVIMLDEPTRGIDVGAKLEVYELVNKLTDAGKAVVLVSSELPELIGMSDRIAMLHDGRISRIFTRAEATPEKLMAAGLGHVEGTS